MQEHSVRMQGTHSPTYDLPKAEALNPQPSNSNNLPSQGTAPPLVKKALSEPNMKGGA